MESLPEENLPVERFPEERFPEDEVPYEMYEQEKKNIITPGELELDEFFVLMMSATRQTNQRVAYRLIGHILDVNQASRRRKARRYEVDFKILGSDMKAKVELRGVFDAVGFWQPDWSLKREIAGRSIFLESGYFSDSDILSEDFELDPVIETGQSG